MSYRDESFLNAERERRRLAANYAGMTDGELQRLARSAESLTELAWMRSRMRWTGGILRFQNEWAIEPRLEMEMRELVTIRQFRDLPEALLAKGSLESSGIEVFSGRRKPGPAGLVHFELHRRHQTQGADCGRNNAQKILMSRSRRPLRARGWTLRTAALSASASRWM